MKRFLFFSLQYACIHSAPGLSWSSLVDSQGEYEIARATIEDVLNAEEIKTGLTMYKSS